MKMIYVSVNCQGTHQQLCDAMVRLLNDLTLLEVGKLDLRTITVTAPGEEFGKTKWVKE